MATLTELIESLLWEDESNTLDFKETQYRFAGATDEQKGEIIKDILAFANAFRREDAYILLGIRDVKGGRGTITGVSNHLDDAHLQQLVNTKTNRTVEFSYHALEIDGKQVGAIRISRQARPSYLRKAFGKLSPNTVYIRHGSSTSIATLEEISRMGVDHTPSTVPTPQLDLQFADRSTHTRSGTSTSIDSLVLITPEKIPDYHDQQEHPYFSTLSSMPNREYYRELVEHTTFINLAKPHSFAIENTSGTTAEDVRLAITIDDPNETLALFDDEDVPPAPDTRSTMVTIRHLRQPVQHDLHVRRTGDEWQITASFGKIQPRATAYLRSRVHIGAYQPVTSSITARLYADNLPAPIEVPLHLAISSTERTITLDDAEVLHAQWYLQTPEAKALQEQLEQEKKPE